MKRGIERPVVIVLTTLWILGTGWPLTRGTSIVPGLPSLSAQEIVSAEPAADESWQVIYSNEQRIGYSRTTTRTEDRQGQTVIVTESEEHLQFKRFGQVLKIQVVLQTEETEEGDMLGYIFEMKNPPAASTRSVGSIEGGRLELETTIAGRKQTRTLNWDPDIKSPAYQDRLIEEQGLKPGDRLSFKTFLPELNTTTTVKMVADDYRTVKMLDGEKRRLLKIKITQSVLPLMTVRAYLDDDGVPLKTETDLLGMAMTSYTVSKDVALTAIAGAELDLAVATLVRVDPIRNAHQKQRVVYRITTPGNDPTKYLPVGPTQEVKRQDAETAELIVTATKPPQNSRTTIRVDPEYTAATQYIQCRDQRVVEHARRAAASEIDSVKVALQMERYVRDKLTKKNFSTAMASAAEVAEKLEGDCTEHAVLLAAMLRAKRIPSRLAIGMVYATSESAFCGHMWTEAFLGGQWYPLDATLGLGGIGAAHIKLAQSSFADDGPAPITAFLPLLNVLGKMKIDVVEID